MKLGNISQTIVPVPNFFVDQKNRTLETFNLYPKTSKNKSGIKKILNLHLNKISSLSHNSSLEKRKEKSEIFSGTLSKIPKFEFKKKSNYYRDYDLLTTFYNLNINKNPRNFTRQWIEMNEEKYIPLYYRNKLNPIPTESKKTYFPDIIDLNKPKSVTKKFCGLNCCEDYNNYSKYKKKQDILGFLQPNLREELQTDTQNLIDKINMNYDIKKWNKFDTRTTFNKFYQTEYSPIIRSIKNKETLSEKFGKTLRLKALNLSNINNQTKKVIEKSLNNTSENDNDDNLDEEKYYKTIVQNSGNYLLKLKYNNEENHQYNLSDTKCIEENKFITSKLNKTKLYKDFPSKTREEFNEKKVVKYKSLRKNHKYLGNILLKDKYGNEEDMKDRLIQEDYLKTMWKRPLHKDAFKLHE